MSDWIIRLIDSTGYAGIFALMLLETVFPPIPSEVVMPVAGLQTVDGPLNLHWVILSGSAGAMTGNVFWYALARRFGRRRFRPFIERRGRWLTMDWDDVEKVQRLFARKGGVVVMTGRLLPTIRSVVSIPAGLVHMKLPAFLFWSTLGTAAWTALLTVAGHILGQSFDRVDEVMGPMSSAIFAAIVLLYVWRQVRWSRRGR
jgi:membrane protein DedA with SNARE-associated domain